MPNFDGVIQLSRDILTRNPADQQETLSFVGKAHELAKMTLELIDDYQTTEETFRRLKDDYKQLLGSAKALKNVVEEQEPKPLERTR